MAALKLAFCSDHAKPSFFTVIMRVLPDPDVVAPTPPFTFNMFNAGTAVPLSVTNEVGIFGGIGPPEVSVL